MFNGIALVNKLLQPGAATVFITNVNKGKEVFLMRSRGC